MVEYCKLFGGDEMYGEEFEAMGPAPAMAAGEYVIWKGKPKKSAYIADKALSMLPIAVIWLIFDLNLVDFFPVGTPVPDDY